MNRPHRNILITFDYELFLGKKSGSIEKCLLEPTEKLIDILRCYNFKAIFFVDTTYLLRLNNLSSTSVVVKKDYDAVVRQIQRLIELGHYVYPHIHPHWLDAEYQAQTNTWDLSDISKYRIEKLNKETIEELFDKSIALLNLIIRPGMPDYLAECYRAGGWSIQPFDCFRPNFIKHQIKYDFSVIPGKYYDSEAQKYDFKNAPVKSKYAFSEDVCQEDITGPFIEFTISTVQLSAFYQYLNDKYKNVLFLLNLSFARAIGDGETVRANVTEKGDIYSVTGERWIASFEGLSPLMVLQYLKEIGRVKYFHFISHPKMLSRLDLFFLSIFMRILSSKYAIQNDFKKVR